MKITHHPDGPKGRYEVTGDGGANAHMTYSRAGETLMIIDHTEVPEGLRGKGFGRALVAHVVEVARAESFKIVPLCPFAAALFRRHPDWHDVLS